jgi:hypothetical protein
MTLILALMVTALLTALGSALVLATMAETQIATASDRAVEALYAADGALERAMQDLPAIANWSDVLSGTTMSTFVDGAPSGQRVISGGTRVDLGALTNSVRCGRMAACTAAQMDAVTTDRPWGANNPRWQLFAYGPMARLLDDGTINSSMYAIVWVGDDPSERDNLPLADGAANADGTMNAGNGVVVLLAHAYGPSGARRMVEATVARTDFGGVRVIAWRELRQ